MIWYDMIDWCTSHCHSSRLFRDIQFLIITVFLLHLHLFLLVWIQLIQLFPALLHRGCVLNSLINGCHIHVLKWSIIHGTDNAMRTKQGVCDVKKARYISWRSLLMTGWLLWHTPSKLIGGLSQWLNFCEEESGKFFPYCQLMHTNRSKNGMISLMIVKNNPWSDLWMAGIVRVQKVHGMLYIVCNRNNPGMVLTVHGTNSPHSTHQ